MPKPTADQILVRETTEMLRQVNTVLGLWQDQADALDKIPKRLLKDKDIRALMVAHDRMGKLLSPGVILPG